MTASKRLRRPEAAMLEVLADNLRRLRTERNLSQEALADLCNLHRTYVGSVERCERNVTLATLTAFSRALSVSVPDLLTSVPSRKATRAPSRKHGTRER